MRAAFILAGLNSAVLVAYAVFERQLPINSLGGRPTILGIAALLIGSAFAAKVGPRWVRSSVTNGQVVLLSCLIVLVAAEILFVVAPTVFSDNVRALVEGSGKIPRERVVEILPHSPYAKPRANATIHIPGYYGPPESFVYEWTTDRLGFKNAPPIAKMTTVHAVAVGDSFTEGMGVDVDDTWASQLSQLGYPTYSLGVQGYAPTQFRGAYEHYGRSFSPRWVVIGYLGGVYLRDTYFQHEKSSQRSSEELPSAIGRLAALDEINRQNPIYVKAADGYRVPVVIRTRHTFATSALVTVAKQTLLYEMAFQQGAQRAPDDPRYLTDRALRGRTDFPLTLMARYRSEFADIPLSDTDPEAVARDTLWLNTEAQFERIITMARSDGANVLLLFFPQRGAAYYKKATGQDLPARNSNRVEAALLARFAERHRVPMVDMTPVFEEYVARLTPQSSIQQYPYLPIDGHPSRQGHALIATEVARFFSNQKSPGR